MFSLRDLRTIAEDWPSDAVLRTVPLASPAVATDFTFTVPGQSTWMLLNVVATLTADANVANRHPDFVVTDGSATLLAVAPGVAQTAGQTATYNWLAGLGYASTSLLGARLNVGIPPVYLAPGYTFGTGSGNYQAGDQWSAVSATVLEIFTGEVAAEQSREDAILNHLRALFALSQEY